MKRKSTFSAIGGYQPFLFCIGMYFVALFFSIFICSAIFYAVNPGGDLTESNSIVVKKTNAVPAGKQVLLSVTGK